MQMGKKVLIIFFTMVLIMTGCKSGSAEQEAITDVDQGSASGGQEQEQALTYEGELSFEGEAEFSIAYDEIYGMDAVERTVKHISSSGEETTNTVKGVLLSEILSAHGIDQQMLGSIRFSAGDGYAIDVPQDIVREKEIVLAWMFDGEMLDERKMPLRVAIDDVRSMYYASNLSKVILGEAKEVVEEQNEAIEKKIVMLDTAIAGLEKLPYVYYESQDMAINVKELFGAFSSNPSDTVSFVAIDGYEKTESYDVVSEGFIKYTGEDAPLFTGRDLPKGMNVKYILSLSTEDVTYLSVMGAMDKLNVEMIDGNMGVNLKEVVDLIGWSAQTYILTAADGYEKQVSAQDLEIGIAYLEEDATVTAIFNVDNPGKSKVKELISIRAENSEKADTLTEDENQMEGVNWVVTIDGLSDGSFEFDRERAERKLTLIDLHTEKMKNDEKIPEDWQGYRVLDILEFLKVDDFESIVVTAQDGYEVELSKDLVDGETILAVVKDGEAMTEEDNLVQLVQNTEFATTWVKGVARITVK
ncbi:hypothetical protein QBE53_04665 [Vallitaleaceae bacterium 9-2]